MLPKGKRTLAQIVPESNRFLRKILHHPKANCVIQLVHVVGVIYRLARPSAFQHNHGECSTGAKFLGHEQAGPPTAYDHHVDGGQCLHS